MAITEGEWRAASVRQPDGGTALAVFATSADGVSKYLPGTLDDARLIAAAPELAKALRQLHDWAVPDEHYDHSGNSRAAFARAAELLGQLGF